MASASTAELIVRSREWKRYNNKQYGGTKGAASGTGAAEYVTPEILRQSFRDHGDMTEKRFRDQRRLYVGASKFMPYALHKLLETIPMPWEEGKMVDVVYHVTGALTIVNEVPQVIEPVFKAQWAAAWVAMRAEKADRQHFQRISFPLYDEDEAPLDFPLHLQNADSNDPIQLPLDEEEDGAVCQWIYEPQAQNFGMNCRLRRGRWSITVPVMSNLLRLSEVLLSDYVDRNYYTYFDYCSIATAKALGTAFPGCPRFATTSSEEPDPDWTEFNDLRKIIYRRPLSSEARIAFPYLHGNPGDKDKVMTAPYHYPAELYVRGDITEPAIPDHFCPLYNPIKAVTSPHGGAFPGIFDEDEDDDFTFGGEEGVTPLFADLPLEDEMTHAAIQLHWAPPTFRVLQGRVKLRMDVNLVDDWYQERPDPESASKVKASYQRLLKQFVLNEMDKDKRKKNRGRKKEQLGLPSDRGGGGGDEPHERAPRLVERLATTKFFDKTRIEWLEAAIQLLQQGHTMLRLLLSIRNLTYVHIDRNFNAKPTKTLTTKERKKSRLGQAFHILRELLVMVKHVVDAHVKFRLGEIDAYQLADGLNYIFTHGAKLTGIYRYKYRVMRQVRRCRDLKHLIYTRFNTGEVKRGPGTGFWEPTWRVWVQFVRGMCPLLERYLSNMLARIFEGRRVKAVAKRITKQRLDSDYDVNLKAMLKQTLLEVLPEGAKASKLRPLEQHANEAWRCWKSNKEWDGAARGLAPQYVALISRCIKEKSDFYIKQTQLSRSRIVRGDTIDKNMYMKNLGRMSRLKLRDEATRQAHYRQHGTSISNEEGETILRLVSAWFEGRGFKKIGFPNAGYKAEVQILELALNKLRQQHNVGDRLTQSEREEQKLIEEAFDHPQEMLQTVRETLAKRRIFKNVGVEFMDSYSHMHPVYTVSPQEKIVDAFLEQYLWFEASCRNLFPNWVKPSDAEIPPVLVHKWCTGINSLPEIWRTENGESVVMLQGEFDDFTDKIDWTLMNYILRQVLDDRLVEYISSRHNVVLEYKGMNYLHQVGLIRGFKFSSFISQLWGMMIDLLLLGSKRAGQIAGPPDRPNAFFKSAVQVAHPTRCYQRYVNRVHVLLKYTKEESEELIERYIKHLGPQFSVEETLLNFKNKRCWPRDGRMRLFKNDILLSKAVAWQFSSRVPPSIASFNEDSMFASVYSETNPNLLFDMCGFEVRLLPSCRGAPPTEAEHIWTLKNEKTDVVEAHAFVQVTQEHVTRIRNKIRNVLMRIGNSAFERIAQKWNALLTEVIPYYREAILGTEGLQEIFVSGEKKIQTKIMMALNSKMPARFPPVLFYTPSDLGGLGMLSVAEALIPAKDKVISRLTDTGIQYFAKGASVGDEPIPNLYRYYIPWESEISEHNKVWPQFIKMVNKAKANNRRITFDEIEDIAFLGIPRISTYFSRDRRLLVYEGGVLCRQEFKKFQYGRTLKNWWFHEGKHGRLCAGLDEYRKDVIQALGGIEAILEHTLFKGTGFPSWEGFEFNKGSGFDDQKKHEKLTKAQRGNLSAVPNRRFSLWWSPTINRSNVYAGFETQIDLTGIIMTGKLEMIKVTLIGLFANHLWEKIHSHVTSDLANYLSTQSAKEKLDVFDIQLAQVHPKKSYTFTNSSADVILQANGRWCAAKPALISTDEQTRFLENLVCTKYWIDVQLRWGNFDSHNVAIYARTKFNEYTRDSVSKYPSVTGAVLAIDLAYNCYSAYGYWIPEVQDLIQSAMKKIMRSNPALCSLRERMKKQLQLRTTEPTEASLSTQNYSELFSDQTIWLVDDSQIHPTSAERTEDGNTKYKSENGALIILNPRTGALYYSIVHKSAFVGQKRRQKLAREKGAEEVATWLQSLPAQERPNKIILTRKTLMQTLSHTLLNFPNIVIGRSDLSLPVSLLMKHERLGDMVSTARESKQFRANVFDDWATECEPFTCFGRLLLILRCLHVRPERAWTILEPDRFATREANHFWPTLSKEQWKLAERQLHDVIIADYADRNGIDPKKLTSKEVQDIILGQESSAVEIQHEEMKQIEQQSKTQLAEGGYTTTIVNKHGEEIVTRVRASFEVGAVVSKSEWRVKAVDASEVVAAATDKIHFAGKVSAGSRLLIFPEDLLQRFLCCCDSRVSVVGILYGPVAAPDTPNIREVRCIVLPPQNGGVNYVVASTKTPQHEILKGQLQPIGFVRAQTASSGVPTTSDLVNQAKLFAENEDYAPEQFVQVIIAMGRGESILRAHVYSEDAVTWAVEQKDVAHAQESDAAIPAEYTDPLGVRISSKISGFTLVPAQGSWNYFFRGNVWPHQPYELQVDAPKEFYHPAHRPAHFLGFVKDAESTEQYSSGMDIEEIEF